MSLMVTTPQWTESQVSLIRTTYAKGATKEEFELFLYKCSVLELDPMKGQIYFVKYGSNPGTIVIGLDGFRSRASKSGKHSGTERGVLRDKEGRVTHGWCKIYRNDWTQPAYEESPLTEYDTKRGQWTKMPETMIKKIAEVAALRMAFPDQLSGMDAHEDLRTERMEEQDMEREAKVAVLEPALKIATDGVRDFELKINGAVPVRHEAAVDVPIEPKKQVVNHATGELKDVAVIENYDTDNLARYTVPFGKKHFGKSIADIGLKEAKGYAEWLRSNAQKSGKELDGPGLIFCNMVDLFERRESTPKDEFPEITF